MNLSEQQWQTQVVGIAKQYGWQVFHPVKNQPTARGHRQTTEPGWPDLVLLGHSRALFVELKSDTGRVRPEQLETLKRLSDAGCETALWRPSNLAAALAALGPRQTRLEGPDAAQRPPGAAARARSDISLLCPGCGRRAVRNSDDQRRRHQTEADNPAAPYCTGGAK